MFIIAKDVVHYLKSELYKYFPTYIIHNRIPYKQKNKIKNKRVYIAR